MKGKLLLASTLIIGSLAAYAADQPPSPSAAASAKIKGQDAKTLYNALTGKEVKSEGAAGHLYRSGKSVTCRYINADMDDKQGKPVSREDPSRYDCAVNFDNNGLAFPGSSF